MLFYDVGNTTDPIQIFKVFVVLFINFLLTIYNCREIRYSAATFPS